MPELKDIILGNVAVERGIVTRETLAELQKQQRDTGLPLGQVMLRAGIVTGPRLIELMKLVNVTIEHLDGGLEVGIDETEAATGPAMVVRTEEPVPAPIQPGEIPVAPVYGAKSSAPAPRPATLGRPAAAQAAPGQSSPRTGIPTPKPMPSPDLQPGRGAGVPAPAPVPSPYGPAGDSPTPRPVPPPVRSGQTAAFDPSRISGTSTPPIQPKPQTAKFDSSRFDQPAAAQAASGPPSRSAQPPSQRFDPSKLKPGGQQKTQSFGSANMRRVGPPSSSVTPAAPPAPTAPVPGLPAPPAAAQPAAQKQHTDRFDPSRVNAGQAAPPGARPMTRRFEMPPPAEGARPKTVRFTFEGGSAPQAPVGEGPKPGTQKFAPAGEGPKPGTQKFAPPGEGSKPKTQRFDTAAPPGKPKTQRFEAAPPGKPKTQKFEPGKTESGRPKTEVFQLGLVDDKPEVQGVFGESVAGGQKPKKDQTRLFAPVDLPAQTPAGKLSDAPEVPIELPKQAPVPGAATPAGRLPAGIDADSKPLPSPLDDSKVIPAGAPPFELPPGSEAEMRPAAPPAADNPPTAPAVPAAGGGKAPGRMLKPEDSGFITQSDLPDFEIRAGDKPGQKPVMVNKPAPEPPKKETRRVTAAPAAGGGTRVRPRPGAAKPAAKAPAPVDEVETVAEEPKKRGKKLLVTLLVILILVLGGGGALFYLKKFTVEDLKRLPQTIKEAPQLLKESPKLFREMFKK